MIYNSEVIILKYYNKTEILNLMKHNLIMNNNSQCLF